MGTTRNLTIRLDSEVIRLVEWVALVEGSSASHVVRDAITAHLDRIAEDPSFTARLQGEYERVQHMLLTRKQ